MAGSSLAALSLALTGEVQARPLGNMTGAQFAPPTLAADASLQAAQQAAAIAQQSQSALARAAQAIQSLQAVQTAARSAAQAAGSSRTLPQIVVPNGLASGGLEVAPGAAPGTALWQNASLPTQTVSGGNTAVTINQTAPKAILNWNTFNVGSQTTLTFNQQGNPTWVALNRVIGNIGPSQILGQVNADGQVYVINQNGIIFGGASQINVGSLVASSLGVTDQQFLNGIVNQTAFDPNQPSNLLPPSLANTAATPAGDVIVEAGALIRTAPPASPVIGGGNVFLFGGNVSNSGTIVTPDGQALLAAGQAVFVNPSQDPLVRGVEVNLLSGGTVTNAAQGLIVAPTGNISLVGLAVKQAGGLLATTSVEEAGSISLLGHDGIVTGTVSQGLNIIPFATPGRMGTVEFSPNSTTAIVPEENGHTAFDGQPQGQSRIRAEGLTVNVLGGAQLVAPSGLVALQASSDPLNLAVRDQETPRGESASSFADAGRVYVADGAVIDVSGLVNVPVPVSDDVITVNVHANELRDSPLNRGGILNGTNVSVNVFDLNKVAPDRIYTAGGLVEVSGFLGLVQRSIDERLTTGGSVAIFSTGDAILRPDAFVDIAGGSIFHQGGFVNVTRLVSSDGRIFDINHAPGNLSYVAVCCNVTVNHPHWGVVETFVNVLSGRQSTFEPAFVEGKSAGQLAVVARQTEIDARVDASAANGPRQRDASSMAANGALVIGESLINPQSVVIAPQTLPPADAFAVSAVTDGVRDPATLLPAASQNVLSAAVLDAAHYGSITITAGAGLPDPTQTSFGPAIAVTGGAALKVADGGSVTLASDGAILLDGQISARGGNVQLTNAGPTGQLHTPVDIVLKPGASIDVSGLWINDVTGSSIAPLLFNGGNVSIVARGGVDIGNGASIDASGGGWRQFNGSLKSAGALPVGSGGDITIESNVIGGAGDPTQPTIYASTVTLNGSLRASGLAGGGQLTLAARDIQIGGAAPADPTTLVLDPSFLASSGFGGVRLISHQGTTVAPGTDIELHTQTLIPNQALLDAPTGSHVAALAQLGTPALFQNAAPVSLTLSAIDPFAGDLVIGAGATINADPGATVSLNASHQLTLDGTIRAPGGVINLDLFGLVRTSVQRAAPNFDPAVTLWIGADARLLAPGLVQTFADASGQPAFRLLSGGSVNINQHGGDPSYYPSANFLADVSSSSPDAGTLFPLGSVVMRPGSIVDITGASGAIVTSVHRGLSPSLADLPVSTDAGALHITASQGLFLDATMQAAGGGPTAAGGTLTVDQAVWAAAISGKPAPNYFQPVGELILTQNTAALLPDDLAVGDAIPGMSHAVSDITPGALQGTLHVSADQIMRSGFDSVALSGADFVTFNGSVDLRAGRSIAINSRFVSASDGATVHLQSAHVQIGDGDSLRLGSSTLSAIGHPVAGSAQLTVDADLIDLSGNLQSGAHYFYSPGDSTVPAREVSRDGFAAMTFRSSGDIRLVPTSQRDLVLQTAGDLNFIAAQIYPATSFQSVVQINANGPDSVITLARSTADVPLPPLSAGGQVQLIAPAINQGGVLRAPFGQITLGVIDFEDPNNKPAPHLTTATVNLLPGSITSVSGAGVLVPYGSPQGSQFYIYGFSAKSVGQNNSIIGGTPNQLSAAVEKIISFSGQSISVASGARIDESGGGDLFGAQFVSGAGGSVDTLNGVNTFAVLPSLGAAYAPRAPLLDSSNGDPSIVAPNVNLHVGDQVHLTGIAGLPAGDYTLLPGHYALLPGAFKVTVAQSNVLPSQATPNFVQPDGSFVVSGFRKVANTVVQDALPSLFVVTPGSAVRQQSQFLETTVSKFFQAQALQTQTAAPRLPTDAGRFVINARNTLSFEGRADFSVPAGGRGGQADIVGVNLELLGPGDTVSPGFIGLNADLVANIGAQSTLIGGKRFEDSANPNKLQFVNDNDNDKIAANIEIGSHAVLQGPEIMLRASNSIVLDPGAVIDTTSSASLPDTFPSDPLTGRTLGSIALPGGAFVMATNAPTALPVVLSTGSASSLSIGAGARIDGGGGITLANTANVSLDPTAGFGAPTVTVVAPTINLGGGSVSGLTLTSRILTSLTGGDPTHQVAAASNLILNGVQGVNVIGSVSLAGLASLTIDTPVIQGFGLAADTVSISADRLTLTNSGSATQAKASGAGALVLQATDLTLGAGALSFAGFQTVSLVGTGQVIGAGSGSYSTTGDLLVTTPLLTGAAGADTTLNASGAVIMSRSLAVVEPLAPVQSIGAHLTVHANSIVQGTTVALPSGVIELDASSDVKLSGGSMTDVSGVVTPFFDVVRISPAGTVTLQSQSGNVIVAGGAEVNLRGGSLAMLDRSKTAVVDMLSSDQGSDAGTLNVIAAAGTAQLDGVFDVTAVPGRSGALASIDVGFADDPAALLAVIRGFSAKQALTLGRGDIVAGNITAHDVELSAGGNLVVNGVIDAGGTAGGTIRLSANNSLELTGDARLNAGAIAAAGGNVFLGIAATSVGMLTLDAGSSIDVSGGGRVWLRAPRVGDAGVAVRDGGMSIVGAREIDLEAVKAYDITATPFVDAAIATANSATTTADKDARDYIGNAGAILAGIGALGSNAALHLMPGVELTSIGGMQLLQNPSNTNTGIDLGPRRYNGEPMVLTLRAAGNILMNGSLSDGFAPPVVVSADNDHQVFAVAALQGSGRSATLRLVAGANLGSADPDAVMSKNVLAASSGSILFNDPQVDTSGFPIASVLRTGTGDIELAAGRDITISTPFGVYTAGIQGPAVAGFSSPNLWYTITGYPLPGRDQYANYPTGGGNITVKVQGDLSSTSLTMPDGSTAFAASELDAFWLWTQATAITNGRNGLGLHVLGQKLPSWLINFGIYYNRDGNAPGVAAFEGIGALGGGNATVNVGGDITNVDVSVPTTGRLAPGGLVVTGGGNLSVVAGGAINNANLLAGRGQAQIRAADIGPVTRVDLLAGDAQFSAVSDRAMNVILGDPTRAVLQQAVDPALVGNFPTNPQTRLPIAPLGLAGSAGFSGFGRKADGLGLYGYFTTQTTNSAYDLRASGGDAVLYGDFVPANIDVVAAAGSIVNGGFLPGPLTALLSPTGQVDFLANQQIVGIGVAATGGAISSGATGGLSFAEAGNISSFGDTTGSSVNLANLVQPDDPRTNHYYAVNGNIIQSTLSSAKQTDIRAGGDIVEPLFELQNNSAADVSLIQAGRDITDTTAAATSNRLEIRIGGLGRLNIEAGRNITLRSSISLDPSASTVGIASVGNADNINLPATGASLSIMAGVGKAGPDIADFIATYLDPANAAGVIENYSGLLTDFMRNRESNAGLSAAQALADFRALEPQQQLPLIEQVYFAEIKAGGRAAADGAGAGGKGFDRAYKAIQTLFPGSTVGTPTTAYNGSISLFGLSRIRTEAGGDIDMLAPGGGVTLGVENQAPNLAGQIDTARPGVLTLRGGDINTFTDGSVIVAQSRVFTELGGNILMFSTNGDLNAGKGKKTTLVTSPPQFSVDPFGRVTKSVVTPQTGAGIATLVGVPGVAPGDVDLFAPHGTIDAGDAGIRVSGNVTLSALQVLNANNIQVQGASVGIPVVQGPPVGALTTANNTAGAAAQQSVMPASASRVPDSIVIVEVLGYGGGDDAGAQPPDGPQGPSDKRPGQQSQNSDSTYQVLGAGDMTVEQAKQMIADRRSRGGTKQ